MLRVHLYANACYEAVNDKHFYIHIISAAKWCKMYIVDDWYIHIQKV